MDRNFEHFVIGGLQRSGTSLLRAILGSHSDITVYQWDLELWTKFSTIYYNKALNQPKQKRLVQDVLNHPKHTTAQIRLREKEFSSLMKAYKTRNNNTFFVDFYREFLKLYLDKTDGSLIGLKTPENEFYTEAIFKEFPKTKFIHIIRNPLDVAVSLKKAKSRWWGGSMNYYSHVRKWKRSIEIAEKNKKQYPNQYCIIKYEDLISNTEKVVQEICALLGVDYQESMLKMEGHPGWKGHNSSAQQDTKIDKKFHSKSVDQYKDKLPQKVKQLYFSYLASHLRKFGYSAKAEEVPFNEDLKYKINYLIDLMKTSIMRFLMRSWLYHPLKRIFN
ncbi:MAG: hypothetical protein C0594_16750 [Marinilabiliales bacterium]|mgnify:CR=1 FL=1|nr:MAG: hypothetical protein C0594_16750 [Marinilabiliales bacterium]